MKKKIFFLALIALIIYAVIFLFPEKKPEKREKKALISAADTAERIDFFALHGWEVEEISGKEITIPAEFSGAYKEYASVQDKQGLPLLEYAGKQAILYTYSVRNYSPENQKMNAELIISEGVVVAALVYSEDAKIRLPVI